MNKISNVSGGKKSYIEFLRVIATFAVVFIHIVMTLVQNYSVQDLGVFNYVVFNDCYILVKWAVPCFIMISGALLLNPSKSIDLKKIWKYIFRMIGVLLTFGIVYSLIELVFEAKEFSFFMLFKAILNTAQGKSWSHMWYIYTLIGLYILTIPLKYVVEKCSEKGLEILVLVLIVGNFIIPTINSIFAIKIENYMLISEYVVYYLLGYYLSVTKRKFNYTAILLLIFSVLFMLLSETLSIYINIESFTLNHQTTNIFTLLLGGSLFALVKNICEYKNYQVGKFVNIISKNSFAIYLVHQFFINFLYKVLKITPLSFPIWLGIVVLFLAVLLLSLGASVVLRKIPGFKRLL